MEEEKQQSRIDSPCSSSLLSCTLSDSVTSDAVWAEIELAERYMVSAMFEEAATTAEATLQTLINETHTKDMTGLCAPIEERDDLERDSEEAIQEVGTSDREAMLESAGMVLLQAYHALGRVGDYFSSLRILNTQISEFPPSVLVAGVCLQISAGVLLEARAALEEFLAVWASNNTREVSSPVAGHLGKYRSAVVVSSSINGESSSRIFLTEEKFGGIAEIYVVQVLVKGFRDPKSAVEWIQHANLTQDKRMELLKKVHSTTVTASTNVATSPVASSVAAEVVTGRNEPAKSDGSLESSDNCSEVKLNANRSLLRAKTSALWKSFSLPDVFFSMRMLLELAVVRLSAASSSRWGYLPTAVHNHRALTIGALMSLFLFLLLRERHYLRRFAIKSLSAIQAGVSDLWQLAFSMQINPLAAVQPLSVSRF
ncbi:unnamed protein product [Sphagnum jensenii]|uniref:Uncharacterized protein n=1 Tax=Sphagnum jensenii TaxID=128206 RepID=A0ABP1A5T3_9BRYO